MGDNFKEHLSKDMQRFTQTKIVMHIYRENLAKERFMKFQILEFVISFFDDSSVGDASLSRFNVLIKGG